MVQREQLNIGIFGSYNKASIGDQAILEGILDQFRRRSNNLSATIFSFDPVSTREMLLHYDGVKVTNGSPYQAISDDPTRVNNDYCVQRSGNDLRQRIEAMFGSRPQIIALMLSLYRLFKIQRSHIGIPIRIPFWQKKFKEIRRLDILIIGGGNLIMDLYPTWPIYPLMYTMISKLARVPVMFYAVGAGPIKTLRSRYYYKFMCQLANEITVRDEESLNLLRDKLNLMKKPIHLSADPAICLRYNDKDERQRNASGLLIGMTVVPYYSPLYWPDPSINIYETYTNYMARLVEDIVAQMKANVVFFGTNYPNDIRAAMDVKGKTGCQNQIQIINRRLSVKEIISLTSSLDIIIGTRLHSLILSLVSGTPFLAFAYQPKVESFCRRLMLEKYVVPLFNQPSTSVDQVLGMVRELLTQSEVIKEHTQTELKRLRQAADISCELAISLVRTSV